MGSSVVNDGARAELIDGEIHLVLDMHCYRLAAIKKAAYQFADRFTAILGVPDGDRIAVALRFRAGVSATAASDATRQFYQELLDQELREHIAEETNPVRTLILAHAFSNVDLIRRDT